MRLWLTVLFAGTLAVGLVVLVTVAIEFDARLWAERLDGALRVKARAAAQAVYYDDTGAAHIEGVRDDPSLAEAEPDLYVVGPPQRTSANLTVLFQPATPTFAGFDPIAPAREAMAERDEVTDTATTDGRSVRVLTVPLYDNEVARGALVTTGDPAPAAADHRRLAIVLWLSAAGLVLAVTAAGYLLAGQSIRPGARALAEQERFLADASHELRTPITALRAVIESGLAGDEPPQAAFQRARALAVQATGLLDDLLTLARIDAGRQPLRVEPLRLDLLVEEVLDGRREIQLCAEPVVVNGDAVLLRRLVTNLLDNAERHGRRINPHAPITVRVAERRLVVADEGPGIEPDLLPDLFRRFRSGRHSGGAGLGLAIAAWIARAHGAELRVENRPSGGASFTLTLPG